MNEKETRLKLEGGKIYVLENGDAGHFSIPRYNEMIEEVFERCRELGRVKGEEYAGDVDRLANFRRNGAEAGVSMEVCWRIYAGKHWDAISTYIRDTGAGVTRTRSEPIQGRIHDMIVYLLLLHAMVEERGTTGE